MNLARFACGRHDGSNGIFVFLSFCHGEILSVCILQLEWMHGQDVCEIWMDDKADIPVGT